MDELKIWDDLEGVDPLGDDRIAHEAASRTPAPGAAAPAFTRTLVWIVAGLAGLGAAQTGAAPTGWRPADVVLAFGFGALVTLATAKARRWSWFVLVGMAALGAQTRGTLIVAIFAVVVSLLALALPRSYARSVGALVGALAVQILVRLPEFGFTGSSAVWATIAVLPVMISAYRRSRRSARRVLRYSAAVLGGVVVLACLGFGVAALSARGAMVAGGDAARSGFDAARAGRQEDAVKAFRRADESFAQAQATLGAPWARMARIVPVVGPQAAAAEAMAVSGQDLSHTAAEAAGTVRYDELRTKGGQVNLPLLTSMRKPVDDTERALDRANERLAGLDHTWLVPPLAEPLADLRGEIDRARGDASLAADAVAVAPSLLGADGPRRYLILFANPSETRFLGGFVGAYGELTADNGKLSLTRSGRIAELSDGPGRDSRQLSGPQEFLERYGRLFPQRYLQNVTASPDFETDAQVARELYPKAGGQPIDGVIYVDPFGLAALLKLTGPVAVPGSSQPLTADNAAMFLLREQYITLPNADDRTDLLAQSSRATFDALTSRELPGPRALAEALGPAVREGRLLAVTFDDPGRALLDRLGAVRTFPHAGPPGETDFFSVRSSNSNPNKIDSFLHRDITYEATVDPINRQVRATAEVVFRNDAPGAGLPPYIIGNEQIAGQTVIPDGTNTMYVSVYTPLELDRITYDGTEVPVAAQSEFGYHTYSLLVRLPPGAKGTLTLGLHGPFAPADQGGYRLVVSPQPMVNPDRVTVRITPAADQRIGTIDGLVTSPGAATAEYVATEARQFRAVISPP